MEGDDGMDSLFAGMEFVTPLDAESPLPSQHSLSAPLDLHDFSDQSEQSQNFPFKTQDTKPEGLDEPHTGSINSILAAYDSPSVKVQPSLVSLPSFHKQSSDASKPGGVRRKRRSVKIGYGRFTADDADEIRSASGQDETASNGSAFDEHSTGLPELVSSPQDATSVSGYKASMSPITNGDRESISSYATDAKNEEPFENLTVFTELQDSADAELLESESHASSKASTSAVKASDSEDSGLGLDGDVVDSRDIESTGATTLAIESAEDSSFSLQSIIPEESSPMDNTDLDTQDATTAQTPSLDEASDLSSQERQTDEFDLNIKVPLGLSIVERLSFIRTAVATNADCIQRRIAAVSQGRKVAAQKRRHIAEKVSRTSAEFKEVEEEMQAACEREDFEKAEQLDEAFVLAQKAREAAMEEFRAIDIEYDKYASEMHDVVQMLIENEEKGFSLLDQLGQEAAETASNLTKSYEDDVKMQTEELGATEAHITLEKEKLMLEVQKVEDSKLQLNSMIESLVQEESEEKQRLVDERQVLLQELEALLAAVRLKETQIVEHDMKIGDLEEKIKGRVSGFEQERLKLDADLHELMSTLDNLENMSESLNEKKVQVAVEGARAQETAEKLLELSSIAKAEAQKLQDALLVRKTAAKIALSSKEKRLCLATQEIQHVEGAHCLQDKSNSLRTSLQELASEKVKLQQELLSASQQISSIEKRLPELETEKKLAAGSRNFKEAGRLAAEAKTMLSTKERLWAESRRVTEELRVLEQELEIRASDLTELENQLQLKEKEAAKARYERLRLLAAATRDERDAASELEDFEEAKSLDVEAEAADREADEIQREYGFEAVVC